MKRPVLPVAALLAAGLLCGCGGTLRGQIASGAANYESGKAAYDRRDWTDAIADLKAYVEQYPGTELTDDALYHLGLSYFEIKDYALASSQLDRLTRDFPTTPFASDALYWLARCDDLQSHPALLDQTETERALQRYNQFLEQYPDHARAAEARRRVQALRDRLAEKLFRSGRLYSRQKQYAAAKIYFEFAIQRYPESRWSREAEFLLAEILVKQGYNDEAIDALKRLLAAEPPRDLKGRAEARLRALEAAEPVP
jgi:outer membrane protein assembly factor BamD